MSKFKTEFELKSLNRKRGLIQIVTPIDKERKNYLRISVSNSPVFLEEDLERFAVNILRALKSKKLKQTKPNE